MDTLRIATRQSRLALWQAEHVAQALRLRHLGLQVELVPMTTQGDRVLDRTLAQVGGKGLFIKELEVAISAGRADIAVHSMKDVPSDLPPDMTLAAMLPRADARDAFVSNSHASLAALPHAARVGTSSLRRQSQLKAVRPDLQMLTLRGNVETRLRKLDAGEYDAIILASAGLQRLGLQQRITSFIEPEQSLPAVGQAIIGIECRKDDERSIRYAQAIEDRSARVCCTAERALAQRLEGSCQSPIAAYAVLQQGALQLEGMVGAIDGSRIFRDRIQGPAEQAEALGVSLAERLLAAGADRLLAELRE
ncbi:MAG: hydroxymethylbilane synthase [Steroidobacteraceae bacterium]